MTCHKCKGSGKLYTYSGFLAQATKIKICPVCGGSGRKSK